MSEFVAFLASIPWFAWIPIIAIVGGITSGTITKWLELRHRHTERMAMIQAGMHPDGPGHAAPIGADGAECKPVGYHEL